LDEQCTVLVPSFSWRFAVPPRRKDEYARNGWDNKHYPGPTEGINRVFTPASSEIDKDMGVVATAVVAREGRVRGNHPLCSFAAVGPIASELVVEQRPDNVYAPLDTLASLGGYVLLIGVDLRSLTLLHLAEKRAGRTLFRRWANDIAGTTMAVEVGGCSAGFQKFERRICSSARVGRVGPSRWVVWPVPSVLLDAITAIQSEPTITHCGLPDCQRCNDAVAGGPILTKTIAG
jgi:aminoglycoside 3-N-acetyltransferase